VFLVNVPASATLVLATLKFIGESRDPNAKRLDIAGTVTFSAGLALLPAWPESWRGQPVDVRSAPTRRGPVSFSVRWHGDRPALLWEAPPGARVTAPGLDPTWSSDAASGEVLLGPGR